MRAKRYNTETYEKKLATVMTRLGIEKYNYDYTRRAAWVTFAYKGQNYRFEHSVENAAAHGQPSAKSSLPWRTWPGHPTGASMTSRPGWRVS